MLLGNTVQGLILRGTAKYDLLDGWDPCTSFSLGRRFGPTRVLHVGFCLSFIQPTRRAWLRTRLFGGLFREFLTDFSCNDACGLCDSCNPCSPALHPQPQEVRFSRGYLEPTPAEPRLIPLPLDWHRVLGLLPVEKEILDPSLQ